jgi:type VI secretion system protein ImpJ
MLMAPQHFQQQDAYLEGLLDERVRSVAPYAWGVLELELDARSLEAGQVALRSFAGVLPHGAVLRFGPGEPEAPAARGIDSHFPPHKPTLEVFLGVPLERQGATAYARTEVAGQRARYIVETRRVLDAVSPGDEASIEFARRNVVLLFGDEPRDDYEVIKIAEIARDAAGRLVYVDAYIPPCLRVGAASRLRQGIGDTLALGTARRRAVAEERRHRDASTVEYSPDDVTRYLALHALSGAIPLLKHFVESGDSSPYQAYLVLVQLAGQLTAFAADEDPAQLPAYVHGDPRKTFEPLFAKLGLLLRAAVAGNVITVAFEGRADGMHLARLADEKLFATTTRFVLGVQTKLPERQVQELVPRVGKLASWSDIPRLVNSATAGVPLAFSARPPREIPVRADRSYFSVATEHELFRGLLRERAAALHLPPPFDPKTTVVELFAIPAE